ncbi:hypothetical protein CRG98_000931 [Punica granatum]|uniref:Uncharacterized protein n=1 Tax=Punica granatum TaxID=22663 RepID=A0A2I0LEQ4_PUNGR|nr:hypothetical protein CRG98_000931 [Punica granatum]
MGRTKFHRSPSVCPDARLHPNHCMPNNRRIGNLGGMQCSALRLLLHPHHSPAVRSNPPAVAWTLPQRGKSLWTLQMVPRA